MKNHEEERLETALMWLADRMVEVTGKLKMDKWRKRAKKYANEMHDHIDKRDGMTVSQFTSKRKELDAEYRRLSRGWKRMEKF